MPLIMMYPRPWRLEFYFRPEGGERSDEQLATALYSDYPAFSFPAFSFSFGNTIVHSSAKLVRESGSQNEG